MKVIKINGYGCEAIYPAHQLLFCKYIPSANVTSIRFIHDPQTYRFDGIQIFEELHSWLSDERLTNLITITEEVR